MKVTPNLGLAKGLESPKAKLMEYSTETDTPPNEKHIDVNKKVFQFTNEDIDNLSTESSRRNSIREERPQLIQKPVPLQELMECHFG